MNMARIALIASLVSSFFIIAPHGASADPHCNKCPYDCGDLGLGHKDCSELPRAGGLCCVDLTKFGLKLAEEHDRVNSSNSHASATRETCPAGFSPSEQKCSQEERRRGCKDMRLPGGLGCVKR